MAIVLLSLLMLLAGQSRSHAEQGSGQNRSGRTDPFRLRHYPISSPTPRVPDIILGRGKASAPVAIPTWSPANISLVGTPLAETASPKSLNFQDILRTTAPALGRPTRQVENQYSTPWRPIGGTPPIAVDTHHAFHPQPPGAGVNVAQPFHDYRPPQPPSADAAVAHLRAPGKPAVDFGFQGAFAGRPPTEFRRPPPRFTQHLHLDQFPPSSYDVPLYAPAYEPGPNNEAFSQAYMQPFDWGGFPYRGQPGQPGQPGHPAHLAPHQLRPHPGHPPHPAQQTQRYKLVFIKTPKLGAAAPPPPAPVPQDQEKTLIYVLVNKPDDATAAPPPPSTTPSRPEVYFIQYKTRKESGSAGDGAKADGAKADGAKADDAKADDKGLYEGNDMHLQRYGPTFAKSVELNAL